MQISAEIRWFWRDALPAGLQDWFCGITNHDCKAGGGDTRQDLYLRDASQIELGIKQRGEKSGIEVKGLVATIEEGLAEGPFQGQLELWTKWTSAALTLPANSTIATNKRRWLRKFDTGAATPQEIALGVDERPLNQPYPARGCNVEVTEIRLADRGEVWWTLGFESFGSIATVETDLRIVSKEMARRQPPALAEGLLRSYPAWLAEQINSYNNL